MARENEGRRKLFNKYSTQHEVSGAGMFHVFVYI